MTSAATLRAKDYLGRFQLAVRTLPSEAIKGKGSTDLAILKKQANTTEVADHYAALLRRCGEAKDLSQGKALHQQIRLAGFETDRYVGNHLLQMYGKCGAIQYARLVFAHMPYKNVFTWNLMMGACINNGLYRAALKTFQHMLSLLVEPDAVTLVSALTACSTLLSLAEGKWLHAYISRCGFELNTLVGTALVNLYAKCGSLDEARSLFDILTVRDAILWNTLIVACAQNKRGKEALQYLQSMQMEGLLPTEVTFASILDACASFAALRDGKRVHACLGYDTFAADVAIDTALVNMYARCGQIDVAESLFNKMSEQNLVSWSAMIAAYAQHGDSAKVLQVSRKMQHAGLIPNEVTLVSILTACSHGGLIDEARYWFTSMVKEYSILPVEEHYNCMIDLLGRMGRLDQGEELLRSMPPGTSTLPWLTLLGACKKHVDVNRARWAAEKVMQLDPDNAAPYVQLSNIYCEAGMWEEAEAVRKMMENRNLSKR
ncbi:hypothetical protein L7F22_036217 [Adiantum nelumboides]|nr:hypothetical protein [Adiantum nelumboides]